MDCSFKQAPPIKLPYALQEFFLNVSAAVLIRLCDKSPFDFCCTLEDLTLYSIFRFFFAACGCHRDLHQYRITLLLKT